MTSCKEGLVGNSPSRIYGIDVPMIILDGCIFVGGRDLAKYTNKSSSNIFREILDLIEEGTIKEEDLVARNYFKSDGQDKLEFLLDERAFMLYTSKIEIPTNLKISIDDKFLNFKKNLSSLTAYDIKCCYLVQRHLNCGYKMYSLKHFKRF